MNSQVERIIKAVNDYTLDIYNFHDTNNLFLNGLYSQMKDIIGTGAIGKVYSVERGKYVIKESSPCYGESLLLTPYCNDINELIDGVPIKIIPSGNKYRYLLPNLLSEAVIGMIFEKSHISIHFGGILGTFILIDKNKPSVYNIMNSYIPLSSNRVLNPVFKNPFHYLFLLFQISTALLNAQETFLFTHYDLHIGNVLLDKWPKNVSNLSYIIEGKNIIVSKRKCPFICKISDYGLSRMETEKTIITPTVTNPPEPTFSEFNPGYDIIAFIGSSMFDSTSAPILYPLLLSNLDFYYILLQFVLWMFNDNEIKIFNKTLKEFERVNKAIGQKYYKILNNGKINYRPALVENNFVRYTNIKSMAEITTYLANILLKFNLAKFTPNMVQYHKYDNVIPFTSKISISRSIKIKGTSKAISADIEPGFINVKTYRTIYLSPPNRYNFTIDNKQLESCPYQDHYITAIFIKSKTFGYRFTTEGYMIDPINYVRTNNIFGFAINGGYFNINKDFLPIGPYKDSRGRKLDYPIPENYRDVFGYVCFRNNEVNITRSLNTASRHDYFLSTGPFLIERGEIVFKEYEKRFACVDPKNITEPIKILSADDKSTSISGYFEYFSNDLSNLDVKNCTKEYIPSPLTLPRCDKIAPGELGHADNPNPRSAVCILKNGDIVFLTVEGRGERGIGIDLTSLAGSIKKTFPSVVTAINLDGGRSTNLAWRSSTSPDTVYIANPNHNYQYPVGNIITFQKPI